MRGLIFITLFLPFSVQAVLSSEQDSFAKEELVALEIEEDQRKAFKKTYSHKFTYKCSLNVSIHSPPQRVGEGRTLSMASYSAKPFELGEFSSENLKQSQSYTEVKKTISVERKDFDVYLKVSLHHQKFEEEVFSDISFNLAVFNKGEQYDFKKETSLSLSAKEVPAKHFNINTSRGYVLGQEKRLSFGLSCYQ